MSRHVNCLSVMLQGVQLNDTNLKICAINQLSKTTTIFADVGVPASVLQFPRFHPRFGKSSITSQKYKSATQGTLNRVQKDGLKKNYKV